MSRWQTSQHRRTYACNLRYEQRHPNSDGSDERLLALLAGEHEDRNQEQRSQELALVSLTSPHRGCIGSTHHLQEHSLRDTHPVSQRGLRRRDVSRYDRASHSTSTDTGEQLRWNVDCSSHYRHITCQDQTENYGWVEGCARDAVEGPGGYKEG